MEWKGSEGLILALIMLIGLCLIVIFLFIIFQKKKNVLLIKQVESEKQFEKEIGESQIEIREQTLRNISWELHDNIGQLLTLAKIQLQGIPEKPENTTELNHNLSNILTEVRALSRIINPDFISNISLIEAIQLEIDRFNRLNYIQSEMTLTGNYYKIEAKAEIVIFRILQEFFSNTIKHSKASKLVVIINYEPRKVTILVTDNGKGFDINEVNQEGIGLINMKRRGKLIDAEIYINSQLNLGTTLKIIHKS